ncbi:MAG: sulfite exporter TauE/SafE family protein [Anaerolineaceae bacterium]|nr:sulfite exporter TauE/SafE family protein [Anaerolineaceae bacterium]
MDFGIVFLTGLTTGGLTCLAIQGGLLATALTGTVTVVEPAQKKRKRNARKSQQVTGVQMASDIWPVVYFLVAKLAAYTLLGFLLGLLGAAVQITPAVQGVMQIGVGLFMLATALNMFNVHPIFRYFIIQPPKALTRLVRNQAKSQSVFTPAFLGLMTVLIPCGTTQAMEVLAISTGNPVLGALVMFIFILGTSPTFLVLGFLATRLRGSLQKAFTLATAALILALSLVSLNTGLNLLGSPLAPERIWASLFEISSPYTSKPQVVDGIQELTINVSDQGYSPNYWTVANDKPIRLRMISQNTYGCALAFTIPTLGIQQILPIAGEEVIDLPPQPEGYLFFTCNMGMYSGTIRVEAVEAKEA